MHLAPRLGALLVLAGVFIGLTAAHADEPATLPAVTVHGLVDVDFALNFNRPADGASFAPGQGTTGKRADEFSLNLAAVSASLAAAPVGAELMLIVGTGADVLHAGEPAGNSVGLDVWRHVARASLTAQTGDFSVEAGIYPSYIGFEGLLSRDNWSYTRGWLAENSPYYLTGVKVAYAVDAHLAVQLHVVNGWQIIGDNNEAKSLGAALVWTSDALNLSLNTLVGPEAAADNDHWRFFGELLAQVTITGDLVLATQLDAGWQQHAAPVDTTAWQGVALFARYSFCRSLALAGRAEVYRDPDGTITGTGETAEEGTLTLEWKPVANLSVKLEARVDHSSAAVFSLHDVDGTGAPLLGRDQGLAIAGAVASF